MYHGSRREAPCILELHWHGPRLQKYPLGYMGPAKLFSDKQGSPISLVRGRCEVCRRADTDLLFLDFSHTFPSFVSSVGEPVQDNSIYYREPRSFTRPGFRDPVISRLPYGGFLLVLGDDSSFRVVGMSEDCVLLIDDGSIFHVVRY